MTWMLLIALPLAAAPDDAVNAAVRRVAPKTVSISRSEARSGGLRIAGLAMSHEAVADFMRAISSLVSTPRGIGRVVERWRDGKGVRVELMGRPTFEDFPARDVTPLVEVELLRGDQAPARRIAFELLVRPK